MKKLILSLAILSLVYSCKKEEKNTKKPSEETKITNTPTPYPLPPVYLDSLRSENEILSHLQHRKTEIISMLENSSSEKNNLMYENYKKENDSALALLTLKETHLLDQFFEFYVYHPETDTSTLKVPEKYKKTVDSYTQTGIEFWDVGEAYTELRMLPDFYFNIFNGKLTADYQKYLEIMKEEDKVLFQSDASISIPWRDVAKRVEVREKFLQDFPSSKLNTTINEELQSYKYAYLLGYDNTSTQNDEGGFIPENLQEFQRFMKENPKSETSAMLKTMLSMPKDRERMYQFVNDKLNLPYRE